MMNFNDEFILGLSLYLDHEKIATGQIHNFVSNLKKVNYLLGWGSFVEVVGIYEEAELNQIMDNLMDKLYKKYGIKTRAYIDLIVCETLWISKNKTPYKVCDPESDDIYTLTMYEEMGITLI